MTTWRYVATRAVDPSSGEDHWAVRELYTEEGNDALTFTDSEVAPSGSNPGELRRDLQRMLDDLAGPYLDLSGETPRLAGFPTDAE